MPKLEINYKGLPGCDVLIAGGGSAEVAERSLSLSEAYKKRKTPGARGLGARLLMNIYKILYDD